MATLTLSAGDANFAKEEFETTSAAEAAEMSLIKVRRVCITEFSDIENKKCHSNHSVKYKEKLAGLPDKDINKNSATFVLQILDYGLCN